MKDKGRAVVDCTGVVKSYRSGEETVHALKGVDLHVGPGEFVAIAGPSGSGKSTFLNLVGCLDRPDKGQIMVAGEQVGAAGDARRTEFRNRTIGFVFQSFNLIPVFTALENVAVSLALTGVSRPERRRRAAEALYEVGLGGLEHRRPGRLSGGQQQRVAVARALVKEPVLVLADEPTANLDSDTGSRILELMRTLSKSHGTAFVFSTHDAMVMEFADRVVRLHDGLVVDAAETV